jgi:heme o synthase
MEINNTHNTLKIKWKALLDLTKFKVSVAVTLSAFSGYVLFSKQIDLDIFLFSFGLLLIIGASSALNHIQERKLDPLMPRTSKRPLPTKIFSLTEAVAIASLLFIIGSVLLLMLFSPIVWLGSLLAAVWYNGVYTPLKRVTPYAIIPGALVGSIPPFIGYWAAGGPLADVPIVMLSAFFFIGQIPHFWLLMKKYHNDYRKAGFPVITEKMSETQVNRMIIIWMAAGIASALLVSVFIPFSRGASYVIVAYCLFFITVIGKDIINKVELKFGKNFLMLNTMYLVIMIVIIVDFII